METKQQGKSSDGETSLQEPDTKDLMPPDNAIQDLPSQLITGIQKLRTSPSNMYRSQTLQMYTDYTYFAEFWGIYKFRTLLDRGNTRNSATFRQMVGIFLKSEIYARLRQCRIFSHRS